MVDMELATAGAAASPSGCDGPAARLLLQQPARAALRGFAVADTPDTAATGATGAGDRAMGTRDKRGFTFVVEPGVQSAGPNSYGRNPSRMREPRGQMQAPRTIEEAWQTIGSVEAMSEPPPNTVAVFTKQNLLAKAVHAAFYGHHPLVLSPDVIWLTIAQGLANHIDQNAEALRPHFVAHEGKKELVVHRPQFVKGSPANDWEGVFPEFSEQITANTMPGTVELIQNEFSTTGPVERVVSHITLMDTVQHYFSYTMCCGCGFPEVIPSTARSTHCNVAWVTRVSHCCGCRSRSAGHQKTGRRSVQRPRGCRSMIWTGGLGHCSQHSINSWLRATGGRTSTSGGRCATSTWGPASRCMSR